MDKVTYSINQVSVRLTDERWFHIIENHDELGGMAFDVLTTIAEPDFVAKGWRDELLAVRKMRSRYVVVVYREVNKDDGFIITAFIARNVNSIKKRGILWSKQF